MVGYVVRVDRWLMRCYDAEIPMGVLGTPEEVAETVVWMYVLSFPCCKRTWVYRHVLGFWTLCLFDYC